MSSKKLSQYLFANLSIYFPSTLIVVVSFVSFWLDPVTACPGRITLVVTSILALVTQLLSIRNRMVPVSYVTALDIWFFACLSMVSLCLFEFSLAYSAAQKVSRLFLYTNNIEISSNRRNRQSIRMMGTERPSLAGVTTLMNRRSFLQWKNGSIRCLWSRISFGKLDHSN